MEHSWYTYDSFFHISPVDAYFFVSRWMLPMFTIFFFSFNRVCRRVVRVFKYCVYMSCRQAYVSSMFVWKSASQFILLVENCLLNLCVVCLSHFASAPPRFFLVCFFCCLLWFCFHLISMLFALWASFCVHIIHLISSIVCITLLSSS